jgi:hypothetical protein
LFAHDIPLATVMATKKISKAPGMRNVIAICAPDSEATLNRCPLMLAAKTLRPGFSAPVQALPLAPALIRAGQA